MTESRKLAAILVSDVVGYSRLAGADENRVLARLRALRSDLIDPTIAVHNGRVVKRTGDGAIVEFRSVVDAVRCAIEIQNAMVERNAGLAEDRRIVFRIGIHLGDVVEESDGDLMGDGVNIAARLEGVCRARRDLPLRGRLPAGEVAARSCRHRSGSDPTQEHRRADPRLRAANRRRGRAQTRRAGGTKPSIAVLAFQNMSGDPEQEYFADGITEDVITDLSKIGSLMVIARNSSFAYKGKPVDIRTIGRELGVRSVLEGSVRRAGGRVEDHRAVGRCEDGRSSLGRAVRSGPQRHFRGSGRSHPPDRRRPQDHAEP